MTPAGIQAGHWRAVVGSLPVAPLGAVSCPAVTEDPFPSRLPAIMIAPALPGLTGTMGCGGNGSLIGYTKARRFRNSHGWDIGLEATGIKSLYSTISGPYKFYLWDSIRASGEGLGQNAGAPIVRLWQNGKIIATVNSKSAQPAGSYTCIQQGGTNWCPFWYVGDLTSDGVFKIQNLFVDENEPLPY